MPDTEPIFVCCSAEVDLLDDEGRPAGMKPCAVKTLQYSTQLDRIRAHAELAALWEFHNLDSVLTCYGVFEELAVDGTRCLHIATE